MAAGLGFKDFVTGEVLTAADVDGYLMQGVWVFASAAARDAAVTSPQEGNFAYLKDTNVTTYYTGSAWANLDTTGMTNPMTTTGDIIYSSPGSTPVRLGIGSTGNVLTVASGVPSWAAPAGGGGKVLQVVSTTYSTATTLVSTSYADTGLTLNITPTLATSKILVLVSQPVRSERAATQNGVGIKLSRGATSIYTLGDSDGRGLTTTANGTDFTAVNTTVTWNYLDSPATTSATTYKISMKLFSTANSGSGIAQWQSDPASIVLLEIGA